MAVDRNRLDDLLLARATEGLDAAAAAELERLLAAEPSDEDGGYERAAAAVCLAVLGARSALPSHVRARIQAAASGFPPAAPRSKR
jgi:hypothetical protein